METARFGNLGSGSLETSGSGKSGPAGLGNSIGEKGQTEQILGQFGKSWGGVLAEAPKLMHGRVGAIRVNIRMGLNTTTSSIKASGWKGTLRTELCAPKLFRV